MPGDPNRARSPAALLSLQRTAGNRATVAVVQRQGDGKGQVLLSPHQVLLTFQAWLQEYLRASGGLEHPTKEMWSRALARTKVQVGPVNWKRWKAHGLPRWSPPQTPAEIEREQAQQEAASQDPMGDLYAAMRARANELNTAATKLNRGVAGAEYFTHKLKSPEGAKGVAYQIAAGTLGLYAAAKHGKDYAASKVDPVGGAIGKGTDWALSEAMGKERKKDPTFEEKAEEFGQTAGTSVELMTGQLHDLYEQTRPSYGSYQAALTAFGNAHSGFWRANDLETLTDHLGTMATQLKAMGQAAQRYLMTCDVLGIRQKAGALATLDKAIVDALQKSVATAVGKLGGLSPVSDVAGGAAEKVQKKLGTNAVPGLVDTSVSSNVSTLVGKGVGKGTGIPMGAPKAITEKGLAEDETP